MKSPLRCKPFRWIVHSLYLQFFIPCRGRLRGLTGSALDYRSLPPEFESRRGHIWRLFHLWLRFITFGGGSAHLAYHVHKSGRKTAIIILYPVPSCLSHTHTHTHTDKPRTQARMHAQKHARQHTQKYHVNWCTYSQVRAQWCIRIK